MDYLSIPNNTWRYALSQLLSGRKLKLKEVNILLKFTELGKSIVEIRGQIASGSGASTFSHYITSFTIYFLKAPSYHLLDTLNAAFKMGGNSE